jgi:uncharacterized protein (TIGR00290 family)
MQEPILMSWSGGKDSCMALREIQNSGSYRVAALLTTVSVDYDRICMHGVRRALLDRQVESLGLPVHAIHLTNDPSNDEYEAKMRETLIGYRERGVKAIAFGDLFLEDIRQYRELRLAEVEMTGVFPLWQRDTAALAKEFIESGFKAVVTCVDSKKLDGSFAGRLIDFDFLSALPSGVDPCGENGEFHSFVFAGPIFKEEVNLKIGETVLRDGFYFCDLLPD